MFISYNCKLLGGKNMKKILIIVLMLSMSVLMIAQEVQKKSDIPENVKISLDGLFKTQTSNGVFKIEYLKTYYWVLEKAVYVNILFRADLENDKEMMKTKIEEKFKEIKAKYDEYVKKMEAKKQKEWKKPEEPKLVYPKTFHNIYVRIMKDGNIYQKYKAPMPENVNNVKYYSFGLILEPGKYQVLVDINRIDNSKDGTQLINIEVPDYTFIGVFKPRKKLLNSEPVFYEKVETMFEARREFNVVANKYEIGPAKQIFYPYIDGAKFKSTETPTLGFFIIGSVMANANPQWNISAKLEIKGKPLKKSLKFKEINMNNPFFFQPITFAKTKKDGSKEYLKPGDYTLIIYLKDKYNRGNMGKGKLEIPFSIVE